MTRAKKRANGEGSFYQLKNRTWVHQITLGRKPDGTPDRKAFKGKTQAECIARKGAYFEEKLRQETAEATEKSKTELQEEDEKRRDHPFESEIVFGNAFLSWLSLYKVPPTVKPATYASYLDIYNVHFFEYFGEMMLFEVTQDIVQQYYILKQLNGARKDGKPGGLSAKTIRNHHVLLKDFFAYAKTKYKLELNPTEKTNRPEVQNPDTRVLATEEMTIFIKEVMRETQRVAMLVSLFTGVRIGELLALEVSDLSLKEQSIAVQRNLIRVKTKAISLDNPHIKILNFKPEKKTHLIVQDTPKTKTSNRVIPLSDDLCELVLRHLFTMEKSEWPNPDNLLFPSMKGTYLDPKSYEKRLDAVSKRCEILKVNPHALRHTFATRLVEESVPLSVVKDLLGHSSIAVTQRYTHRNSDLEREAVGSISAYMTMSELADAPKLNGTKRRAKFADLPLPVFTAKA